MMCCVLWILSYKVWLLSLTVDRSGGGSDSRYSTEWCAMRSTHRAPDRVSLQGPEQHLTHPGVCVFVCGRRVAREGGEGNREEKVPGRKEEGRGV